VEHPETAAVADHEVAGGGAAEASVECEEAAADRGWAGVRLAEFACTVKDRQEAEDNQIAVADRPAAADQEVWQEAAKAGAQGVRFGALQLALGVHADPALEADDRQRGGEGALAAANGGAGEGGEGGLAWRAQEVGHEVGPRITDDGSRLDKGFVVLDAAYDPGSDPTGGGIAGRDVWLPLLCEHLSEPARLAEAFRMGVHEGDEGNRFHETMIPAAPSSTSGGVGERERRSA
jgi:hypothetical protein